MKLTIGKRIVIGFSMTALITAALGTFSLNRLGHVGKGIDYVVNDPLPNLQYSGEIKAMVQRNVALILQHVLAPTQEQKQAIDKRMGEVRDQFNDVVSKYEKTITQENERQLFAEVNAARASWLAAKEEMAKLSREMKMPDAMVVFDTKARPAFTKLRDTADRLADLNQQKAQLGAKQMISAIDSSKTWLLGGMAAALLASGVMGFTITRGVTVVLRRVAGALAQASDQVASASSQISVGSQSLAEGASEQAASLEETSSSMEEVSSMTRKNADTAQQASTLSAEAKQAADDGNTAMAKMNGAIQEIEKHASQTAKIIKVIDEIAFQTNLLALNAAVEAARAGDAGKGFAVVAAEVRSLAQRSAEAAKNTAALIEESVASAKHGAAMSVQVTTVLEHVTASNVKVNALVGEIATASEEQAKGIDQVNTTVAQMDKVTQGNAATAEESASASEELAEQAKTMNASVQELLALVNGASEVNNAEAQATYSHGAESKPHVAAASHLNQRKAAAAQIPLNRREQGFTAFNKAA